MIEFNDTGDLNEEGDLPPDLQEDQIEKKPDRIDYVEKTFDWKAIRAQIAKLGQSGLGGLDLTDEQAEELLFKRAAQLAKQIEEAPEETAVIEIVTFRLGEENYSIETRFVREIVPPRNITVIPSVPAFVLGVMNLRGEILPIFDIREFLGLTEIGLKKEGVIMVIGKDQVEFGMVADSTDEVREMLVTEVLDPPASGEGTGFIRGVTKEALIILDGEVVIGDERLFIDRD